MCAPYPKAICESYYFAFVYLHVFQHNVGRDEEGNTDLRGRSMLYHGIDFSGFTSKGTMFENNSKGCTDPPTKSVFTDKHPLGV